MYKVSLGIEHLMTGVQVRSEKGDVLTFQQESSSIVRVISDSPIEVWWPVKQIWTSGEEFDAAQSKLADIRYSEGEAEWWAKVMAERMRNIETCSFPTAVVKSMRAKFGADADGWLAKLKWSELGRSYYFFKDGIFHGVEPDGYFHT